MCGIIGYTGLPAEGAWGETYAILEALLVAAEERGRDATGFVAATEPFKQPHRSGLVRAKRPVRASRFIRRSRAWRGLRNRRCTTVVGHTRLATAGPPANNANNHPHSSRDNRYHVAHNGMLPGHRLAAASRGASLATECDSELLLKLAEMGADPAEALGDALHEVVGSMAVALFDAGQDRLWLARNRERPLWVARLRRDSRWFFASTQTILWDALESVLGPRLELRLEVLMPLASGHVHGLSPAGELLAFDA